MRVCVRMLQRRLMHKKRQGQNVIQEACTKELSSEDDEQDDEMSDASERGLGGKTAYGPDTTDGITTYPQP